MRHALQHFGVLLINKGSSSGTGRQFPDLVNYDKRERHIALETEREVAVAFLNTLKGKTSAINIFYDHYILTSSNTLLTSSNTLFSNNI